MVAGLAQLLVMPTRTGLFPAFRSSSFVWGCLLPCGGKLAARAPSGNKSPPQVPCWCLIGQKWVTWPLLDARKLAQEDLAFEPLGREVTWRRMLGRAVSLVTCCVSHKSKVGKRLSGNKCVNFGVVKFGAHSRSCKWLWNK